MLGARLCSHEEPEADSLVRLVAEAGVFAVRSPPCCCLAPLASTWPTGALTCKIQRIKTANTYPISPTATPCTARGRWASWRRTDVTGATPQASPEEPGHGDCVQDDDWDETDWGRKRVTTPGPAAVMWLPYVG